MPRRSPRHSVARTRNSAVCARTSDFLLQTEVRSRGSVLLDAETGGEQTLGFYSAEPNTSNGPGTAVRMQRYARESLPLAIAAARAALGAARLNTRPQLRI